MKPDGMIFCSVTALSANAAAVVAMPEGTGEGCDGNESSRVFVSTPDGWVGAPPVPWPTVACLDTEEALVGVGLYGHLQHLPWAGGEIRETELPATQPLRVQGARRVGDRFYVCAMARQVFVSPDGGTWATMNDGLQPSADEPPVTALSNLAGNGTNLVAVGVHGSVFLNDGGPWQRMDPGVRSWLKDVAWHEDALWVCGKDGLLLTSQGRSPNSLTRIDSDTSGTLRTLTTFQGRLYALGDQGLFRIDGTSLIPIPTPAAPRAIDACADTLWIATEHDLFLSPDGEHFTPRD